MVTVQCLFFFFFFCFVLFYFVLVFGVVRRHLLKLVPIDVTVPIGYAPCFRPQFVESRGKRNIMPVFYWLVAPTKARDYCLVLLLLVLIIVFESKGWGFARIKLVPVPTHDGFSAGRFGAFPLLLFFVCASVVSYVAFVLSFESNLNGSNIFGTMGICSRHG